MSLQALGYAISVQAGSPTRKLVLMALAECHNGETGRCDPGIGHLQRLTELGERAIRSALAGLADDGIILRERKRRADGSLGTYRYTFPSLPARDAAGLPAPDAAGLPARGAAQNQEGLNQEGLNQDLAAAPLAYDPLKGTKIDGRNLPWDELVRVTNADDTAEKGRIARALKTIRELVVRDSSPQTFDDPHNGEWWIARQITARAGQYRRRWPNVELTPTALAANWTRVTTTQPGADPISTLEAAQRGIDSARGAA